MRVTQEYPDNYLPMTPEIGEAIAAIRNDLKDIRGNHIDHIEDDVRSINKSIGEMQLGAIQSQNDVKWMKIIGGFVVAQGLATLTAVLLK